MDSEILADPEARSPLETFLRDYAEVAGGLWDEVEPQVYDLMLPPSAAGEPDVVRVAFDPEALPEHPGAQLASYGTPLVDRLLADALERGRRAKLYFVGLNLAPQNLAARVARALTLTDGLALRVERVRPLHFPQALFWFEATFISDQKEHDLLSGALDLHYGRHVRHLEPLLDHAHHAEEPWSPLPEARHAGLAAAYPIARDRVLRTLAALANTRARELSERLDRQVERMGRYYADLRAEIDEQAERARTRGDDLAKFLARRETLVREERLRITELRQKSTLKVQLRLLNLLVIDQPKLLVTTRAESPKHPARPLELVWDPLIDGLEAAACPGCGHPTFTLGVHRQGRITCPHCASTTTASPKAGPR